tara:strand:+ start:547 stop:1770 length:1224 start_codon:yes stop_codon:yes gene_type:complete
MLTKPLPVSPGIELIEAKHLNDLVDYYNEIWSEPKSAPFLFDANHNTGTDDRRFGWGQTAATIVPTPALGNLVTISDINQAIAQVNAGLYHTEDDPTTGPGVTGLYPLGGPTVLSAGSIIPVTLYNDICTKAETLVADKYKVDWANLSLSEVTSINTQHWDQDLEVVHKFEFSNYAEARYFFNSGGELAFELAMAPGGPASNMIWQQIFEQFDWIKVGAEGCKILTDNDSGEIQYDVMTTSTITPRGFYGIDQTSAGYTTILDAGVFRFTSSQKTGEYAYAYVYVYSEYNSRRIRIQIKGEETANKFNVYVKIMLIEDADDTFDITQPITLTSGYVQPSTTPLATDGNKTFMTDAHGLNQFIERVAPIVTEHTPWTKVDLAAGEQIDWDVSDPGTNWTASGKQFNHT